MNGRERMMAALRGEPVDRAPIWLREGFPVLRGPADEDDFQRGWQAEPLYRELYDYVRPHVELIQGFGGFPQNRWCMAPWSAIERECVEQTDERMVTRTTIHTPKGDLYDISERRRGHATSWTVKHMVETREELEMLVSVPFVLEPERIEDLSRQEQQARETVGERGITRGGLSSPIVCISGAMPFQMFLELSMTEREWFHELCEEITNRYLTVLEAWWDHCEPDCTFNIGGSEQCTPPMMRPEAYDEYVVPYEGRMIRWLKERGKVVNVHCHGKVAHALKCMVEEGADSTDPVEPPPAGDCTYAEAREIVGEELTLMGNLEWDRLEHGTPEEISAQVREILSHGHRRLVLGASAGPISAVTPRLVANYKAWIDTALECS